MLGMLEIMEIVNLEIFTRNLKSVEAGVESLYHMELQSLKTTNAYGSQRPNQEKQAGIEVVL